LKLNDLLAPANVIGFLRLAISRVVKSVGLPPTGGGWAVAGPSTAIFGVYFLFSSFLMV
jgi:hypothetical protein